MLIKNNKWLTLVELIVATAILSFFYLGLFHFSDFQNKYSQSLKTNIDSLNLYLEAKNIIKNVSYENLDMWIYRLYFEKNSQLDSDWKYVFEKLTQNITDKIDVNNFKLDNIWKYDIFGEEKKYYRLINVENIIYPYINTQISLKKVTVEIKDWVCENDCYKNSFYIFNDVNYYE